MIMWGRVQKPLEGLDDAPRVGVVVARRHVRDGLVLGQEHRDDLLGRK